MTTDGAITNEGSTGNIVGAEEGVRSLGDGDIDITETSPEDKIADENNSRYDRIREKYNNDTDKIVKAYDEAQRKITELSNTRPQAPEKYEFDFSGLEGLPPDFALDENDPLLSEMLPVFKENNITGKAAQDLANKFIQWELANAPNLEEEGRKLGAEKDEIIQRLTSFSDARLTEEERQIFEGMTATAEQTKLLYKLVSQMGEQPMADNQVDRGPAKSAQEYRDEAMDYKNKHSKTISGNKEQQNIYTRLMIAAERAAEKEQA